MNELDYEFPPMPTNLGSFVHAYTAKDPNGFQHFLREPEGTITKLHYRSTRKSGATFGIALWPWKKS